MRGLMADCSLSCMGRSFRRVHHVRKVTASHEIDVLEVLDPARSVRRDGEDRTKASSQIGTVWSVDCGGADGADHELTVDVAPP